MKKISLLIGLISTLATIAGLTGCTPSVDCVSNKDGAPITVSPLDAQGLCQNSPQPSPTPNTPHPTVKLTSATTTVGGTIVNAVLTCDNGPCPH